MAKIPADEVIRPGHVVVLFHLTDILFALAGGFYEVLGLVVGVSALHIGLLALSFYLSRRVPAQAEQKPFSVRV